MFNRFTRTCGAVVTATLLLTGVAMAASGHHSLEPAGPPARSDGHSGSGMPGMERMPHGASTSEFSFGEPATPAAVDRTVQVAMKDMSFEPTLLTFEAGETVRFIVINTSEIDHDFTVGDVEAQTAHRREMAEAMETNDEMEHAQDPNAMSVKAGETGELIWKFTRVGSFEFDCNVPGHYEAGMSGVIAVSGRISDGADALTPPTMPGSVPTGKTNVSMTTML